ncbi:MAG: hypothetical protein KKA31_02895 [Candidatus Margulisbacteria bacterium]|nr:hypothetical protein [Candidatus Margulisiibacteriota bacterium]
MYKIKIIGPKYLIAPLAILGLEILAAESELEARGALNKATIKNEPALIFITERLAADLQDEISSLNSKPDINIVMLPDNKGSLGLASFQIEHLVKNSIGAEVVIRK